MVTIKLKHGLDPQAEQWLAKNVGPRMHYIHNSIGGQGWIAKSEYVEVSYATSDGESYSKYEKRWNLKLEDDRLATWFLMMFPQ